MNAPTVKDENRALQEMARELTLLRSHNQRFKANDPQHNMLMFAEAALTCMTMEHFVRIVVSDGSDHETLAPLLRQGGETRPACASLG